jgi:hypothetical protein
MDLLLDSFYENKTGKHGRESVCKKCRGKMGKDYRASRPDKEKERHQKYRASHIDEMKAKESAYKQSHKEEIRISSHSRYEKQKDVLSAKQKQDRKDNPEKYRQIEKRRRDNASVNQTIAIKLRGRFNKALEGNFKSGSAIDDLGCSLDEFKVFIEKLWWPGMNWENQSRHGWHFDHIIPLFSFNLEDSEQVKIVLNYTNYQPLWADDNESKKHRLDWAYSETKHELPDRLKRHDKTYWGVIL